MTLTCTMVTKHRKWYLQMSVTLSMPIHWLCLRLTSTFCWLLADVTKSEMSNISTLTWPLTSLVTPRSLKFVFLRQFFQGFRMPLEFLESAQYRVFTKIWHKIVFAVFTQPVGIASSIQHEQIASSFLCYNIQLINACGASIGHSVNLCASAAPQALADFSCDANHLSIHLIPFLGDQLSLFSASKTSTYTGVLNRP